ncbi:MAG: hypothetical protein RDV48_04845 [Candidatus Eremiobacteraeota bacterium]|nr:hypothetical protein [Candidatus Eremiobacteraeota bacterium]
MLLPKGNPLIEKITLPFTDINTMIQNLEQQGFTGYVLMEIFKTEGVIFFSHGEIIRALEIEDPKIKVLKSARLINKVKSKEVPVSSYVLSPQIVSVLSTIFAYDYQYKDYEVKKKEFKKVLSALEADNITGILQVIIKDADHMLLIDHGKIVTDSFANEYGQILCGLDAVNSFLDIIFKEGARINVLAEKADEIEFKKRTVQEELEKERQLIAKTMGGFIKAADTVKIEEHLMKEWGIKTTATITIEVETADGKIYTLKTSAAKHLGGYLSLAGQLMKKMNVKDGDFVNVRPIA